LRSARVRGRTSFTQSIIQRAQATHQVFRLRKGARRSTRRITSGRNRLRRTRHTTRKTIQITLNHPLEVIQVFGRTIRPDHVARKSDLVGQPRLPNRRRRILRLARRLRIGRSRFARVAFKLARQSVHLLFHPSLAFIEPTLTLGTIVTGT
jgi:hypothetical protein